MWVGGWVGGCIEGGRCVSDDKAAVVWSWALCPTTTNPAGGPLHTHATHITSPRPPFYLAMRPPAASSLVVRGGLPPRSSCFMARRRCSGFGDVVFCPLRSRPRARSHTDGVACLRVETNQDEQVRRSKRGPCDLGWVQGAAKCGGEGSCAVEPRRLLSTPPRRAGSPTRRRIIKLG